MILTAKDIYSRLTGGKPLSIVRIGDGEGIVLNATKDLAAFTLCNDAVLKRQMGYYPPMDQVYQIRENLIEAYRGADIIGIPMHKQATSNHWGKVKQILDENVLHHTSEYCSIDVHYDFLNDGLFATLLQNLNVLNYISCRDLDVQFSERFNIRTVNKYLIAPEAKFTSGYDGEAHYPVQFNKVQRWMEVVRPEGRLLLVGAGVIGKIYCNWWRDRGGVAFDIGSIFDEWYGKATRGPERGLDKDNSDKTHKL